MQMELALVFDVVSAFTVVPTIVGVMSEKH